MDIMFLKNFIDGKNKGDSYLFVKDCFQNLRNFTRNFKLKVFKQEIFPGPDVCVYRCSYNKIGSENLR